MDISLFIGFICVAAVAFVGGYAVGDTDRRIHEWEEAQENSKNDD